MAANSFALAKCSYAHEAFTGAAPRLPRSLKVRKRRALRVQGIFGGNKDKDVEVDATAASGGEGGKNPFSNFSELLKTAKEAQARAGVEAAKAQEELSGTLYEGYDADETVKVVISGNQEPREVEITEDAMSGGADELSGKMVEAMKDAHQKSVLGMKDRMKRLYEDLGFPMPPQNM